ncbi:HEAT repeat-containing protein 6 [Rhynchospora pubera]|uniref:HEAT repeat-containing protein 6 n=1 Tax=Rhynchospora pubera TaxID=906938 RepID=A0AAV8E6V2_9POAL|nr:HEAT repeat-containing protein 6 [Rhynchospora pubera]
MASVSSGTRLWRTTFLTLRDETLPSPDPPTLLSLLRRLLLSTPSSSLLSAASLLPPHEVTSDVVFLTELGISVSKCDGSEDALSFMLHLINSIMCKVCLDINASSWSILLNFVEASLTRLDRKFSWNDCSTGSGIVSAVTDSLAIISSMVKAYERNASLSENVQLTGVLLSIISLLHPKLLNINHSGDSGFVNLKHSGLWDMQTTAFSILGKVLTRIGSTISADLWQSIVEVLRKMMDFLASNNLVLEDNVISRFLTAFLHCLHLVLSDPKGPLASHMAGFVPTLQLYFMYGVSAISATTESKKNQSSPSVVKSEMTSKTTSTAYKPPHLRRKEAFRSNNSSDSESSSRYDFCSSDSDHSDTDGYGKVSDRYRSSKTRLNAICCIQDLCRADAKSLTSFWPLLLPENDVLMLRKNQATLMTSIIFDPIIKVRVEAVSAIVTMLEGQALVLSQVAEYKELSKPGSFTTLSSSLGRILMQLHTGVLYLIQRETHSTLVASLYKLLVILISVTPYGRMPGDLLPTVISSLCNRIARNNVLKNEHYGLVVHVLSCLEMAFSKSPPSVDALNLLESSLEGLVEVEGELSIFTMLFTCLDKDMNLSIKCEALQVLKAIYHNYPSTVRSTWRQVSNVVEELLQMRNFDESTSYPSKGDSEKNAVPTFERCTSSVVKVMDECLRAASGFQGTDDRLEFRLMDIQQVSDKTRKKRVSSAPCFELQQGLDTSNSQPDVDNFFVVILWNEAIERHMPVALCHSAPSVKAASVTCFAGMTSAVFFSLSREKQEFVIFSSVGAATKEAIPALRSAACRAIGIISSFPPVISNSRVLYDFIHAVELNTRNQLASVRITASWALANICDSVRLRAAEFPKEDLPCEVVKSISLLVESALRLAKDGDKIKSNAVRALGYLSRFIRFDDPSGAHNNLSSGDSNWLERMVQAFLSCVTTGNVKVQWNVCHALSNLFMNETLKLQSTSWAPTVFHILLLLIRDSTNYKIRIHAAVALAVPTSRIEYGSSFSDVVQGIVQVIESLSSDHSSNPSSYKYKDNLEKQLAFTALHLIALISHEEDQSLKDFLVKKASFLEDLLKPLCSSFNEDVNQSSSSNDNSSSEKRDDAPSYVANRNILVKSLEALYNLYESSRQQIAANRFEKLVKSLS